MFLAGPGFKNPNPSEPASDFRPFDPGIIKRKLWLGKRKSILGKGKVHLGN